MKNFLLAFIQVFFVSLNIKFISLGNIIGISLSSFIISYIWTHNVKKAAFGSEWDKIIYSLGAMCGGVVAYLLSNYF